MRVLHLVRDKGGILDGVLAEFRQEMILVPLTRVFQGQTLSDDSDLLSLHRSISRTCSSWAPHQLHSPGALASGALQQWGQAARQLPVLVLLVWY